MRWYIYMARRMHTTSAQSLKESSKLFVKASSSFAVHEVVEFELVVFFVSRYVYF